MPIKFCLLVAIVSLLGTAGLKAQADKTSLLYYHLGEKDGLADNDVTCFFQDSRGVMWMGTHYGLNSFDGSVVTAWQTGPGAGDDRLMSNDIRGIVEDKHQTLWIATSGALSSFNLLTKKFYSYRYSGSNFMRGLVCDGDKIWIATSDGLLVFDAINKTFRHFTNTSEKHPSYLTRFNNDCNAILLDRKKRLWLATANGVWLFDRSTKLFEPYDDPQNDPRYEGLVNTVFEDHEGKIWIGCWGTGLKQIIPETRTVINYERINASPHHVMSIAEQKSGPGKYALWSSDMLTAYDRTDGTFERNELKPLPQAASLDTKCIYVSRDDLLWISTVKGVYIMDPSRQLFKHHFLSQTNYITAQTPAIYAKGGRIWLGGDKELALTLFDDSFHILKDLTPAFRALKGDFLKHDFAILNIIPDENNALWFSTTEGVLKKDLAGDKLEVLKHDDHVRSSENFVNNVYIDKDQTWCFLWRRGILQFDPKSRKFVKLIAKLPEASGTPKGLNIADAARDPSGNIWLTDLDYGVVKYTASTRTFKRFVTDDIQPYSRALNIMLMKGKLWLMVNTSVVAIDPKNDQTQSWPLPPGMNKDVYAYTSDKNDNLWIATKTGLVIFKMSEHSFSQYTEEDGLINNDMNGVLHKLPSGKMIYAGENYVTSFNPDELLRKPAKKNLLLTAVIAADRDLLISRAKKIATAPGERKISFNWALINYTNPLQNRYYGKLDKVDKEWNYAGNTGHIEYNSLSPGDYKFHYKATTADGLISAEEFLNFTVTPPFWQSWWFRTLVIAMILACSMLYVRNVRLKEQRRSALQLRLSALEMKALRAQMNPHFIFNALNSIQECIVTKNTRSAYSYLSNFSKLVRMILENSEKQFITLADDLETLRLYLSLEKLRFDDSFDFEISIADDIDTSFIRIPAMMIQPFAENALWHGLIHKAGKKKLNISFKQENSRLVCTIEDNGIGRKRSAELKTLSQAKNHSMGIKITEERLQLLKADATILIADLMNNNGEASGTKVTIFIPLQY